MSKQVLIKTIKNVELKRHVAFVLGSDSNSKNQVALLRKLCYSIAPLNQEIYKILDEISLMSYTPVKLHLSTSSPQFPIIENNIKNLFNSIEEPNCLRIIIQFCSVDNKDLSDEIHKSLISHLVKIVVDDVFMDENALNSIYLKNITTNNLHKILNIIKDVMIDISMYHTVITPILNKSNLEFKRNFSFHKLNYILKNNLKSKTWTNKDYIALAGYFHSSDGFRTAEYILAWNEILNDIVSQFPELCSNINVPITTQLKRHKYYGELPINRINKICKSLAGGNYLLLRIVKKPHESKKRREIAAFFKGKVFRLGKINIIPESELASVARYVQWVSLFKIKL